MIPMHDDPSTWRRIAATWWQRALLVLIVVAALAGAIACALAAPPALEEERDARADGPVVADVSDVACSLQARVRGGSRRVCSVSLSAEVSGSTVSTVVERTGRPELDGPDEAQTTVIFVHPETGEIWFDDRPEGSTAAAFVAFAVALVGVAAASVIALRAEMHLVRPFIPSPSGPLGRTVVLVAGGFVGSMLAPYVAWWALIGPVVAVVVAIAWWARAPMALEVEKGQIAMHRRGGRRRTIPLGSLTSTEVGGGRDPYVDLRHGTRRLRVRTTSWAARGALLRELDRCLALSGAPASRELSVARLRVRGW
jgi:hypothetical protein